MACCHGLRERTRLCTNDVEPCEGRDVDTIDCEEDEYDRCQKGDLFSRQMEEGGKVVTKKQDVETDHRHIAHDTSTLTEQPKKVIVTPKLSIKPVQIIPGWS